MADCDPQALYWGFIRYVLGNPHQSVEQMTKKDFITLAEDYAIANKEEVSTSNTVATTYDDALVTTATAYTDLQLPGVSGADLDAANTFAKKEAIFAVATYPGHQQVAALGGAVATDYDNQALYGL